MAEVQYVSCVAAILCNQSDQVLLIQRDEKPGLAFAGYWSLPGGLVEEGETPDSAIAREIREEIELTPNLRNWKVYERSHKEGIIVVQYVYVGRTDQPTVAIHLNEGQAIGYFAANDIQTVAIAFGFDLLLLEFFATLGLGL
jgi:8-oxo-dGTP diphosphatase